MGKKSNEAEWRAFTFVNSLPEHVRIDVEGRGKNFSVRLEFVGKVPPGTLFMDEGLVGEGHSPLLNKAIEAAARDLGKDIEKALVPGTSRDELFEEIGKKYSDFGTLLAMLYEDGYLSAAMRRAAERAGF